MDLLLVNPPYSAFVYARRKIGAAVEMPLGLAYLAAAMEKEGFQVAALDANAEGLSLAETARRVAQSPAPLVGVTSTTTVIPLVYQLCELIREGCDKTIIVGGPHVTFMDGRTLEECPPIDMVARGEGEITLVELLRNQGNPQGIKGLTYREKGSGRIVANEPRGRIENLDELPFPARHLFPLERYRPGAVLNIGISGRRYASLLTARGCPNRCTYCSSTHFWGPKLKMRSPENVVAEMKHLVGEYGVKQIFIKDDTFNASARRAERICQLMLEENLKIKWCVYARVNNLSKSLLKMMKAAGCFGLDFGIESGSQEILDRAQKGITLEQSRKALQAAREEGLMTYASFMFGLPGDDWESANQTIDFALELSPDIAHFFIATPFPGTEFYQEALGKGWIEDFKTWKDFDISSSTKCRNDDLSNEDIQRLLKRAYRRFYFRPAYLWQALKRILRHPRELRPYVLGGLAVFDLAEA